MKKKEHKENTKENKDSKVDLTTDNQKSAENTETTTTENED